MPTGKTYETTDSGISIKNITDQDFGIMPSKNVNEGVLQYGETDPITGKRYEKFTPNEVAKPVSMIDTDSAISQVNKQKGYLDTNYPGGASNSPTSNPPFGTSDSGLQKWANQNPEAFDIWADKNGWSKSGSGNTSTGKAYYANASGQEAEYTQEQLNDPQIQNFLSSGGYVLTKSDGVNLSENDPRANILQSNLDQSTKQVEGLINDFLSYNVDADPAFQAKAKSINAEYDRLRRNMEKTNYQRARAFETAGFRTGATQYANQVQMGIEGEELTQANNRIADISAQESEAIASARLAFETGKFNQFNQKVNALKDLREMKAKELEDYNTKIANFNKALQEEQKQLFEQEKFEFEVYKFEQEQKAKAGEGTKPMVVAPGSSIYDPSTGEFIGTAPKPVDNSAPEIKEWNGQVHQWNPNANGGQGSWEVLGSIDNYGGADSQEVIDWANQVNNGTRKFSDVPDKLKTVVNSAIANLPPKKADVERIKDKIATVDNLLDHKGIIKAVGINPFARVNYNKWSIDDKAQKNDFIAKVEQLVDQKTLENLINAKNEGATFGALSEGELKILQSSASIINNWARDIDKDGKTDFYEIGEKQFKEELNKFKNEYDKLIKDNVPQETFDQKLTNFYNQNPDKRQAIDYFNSNNNPITNKPYTDEEKAEALGIPYSQEMGAGVLTPKFVQKAPEGTKGGQCGIFTRQLVDFPSGMGNAWSEKQSFVRKNGILVNEWKKNPKVGDVVFAHYDPTYGHAMVINEILPGGKFKVSESNWRGDERVSHNRIVDFNDPKIYGAVRGKLKV